MVQTIFVVLLFVCALAYVGMIVIKSFQAKSCASGCGSCAVADVAKAQKQIKAKHRGRF